MTTYTTDNGLQDALARIALSNRLDGTMSLDDWSAADDYKAEHEAENAWLRHAESLGWEEALVESYIESGLMVRW